MNKWFSADGKKIIPWVSEHFGLEQKDYDFSK